MNTNSSGRRRHRGRHVASGRRTLPGAAPGTIAVDPQAPAPVVSVLAYGPDDYIEEAVEDLAVLPDYLERWPVCWVNVCGLGDAATLEDLGRIFDLHPLVLEDIVNVHQRPKVEDYEGQLFVVTRMVYLAERLETEQLSIVLGSRFVVTFQERQGDILDPLRERIRSGRGIRRAGSDYLTYAIVDAVVDHYFPLLEHYGEYLEELEDGIVADPDPPTLSRVREVKHDLLAIRRAIWPQRDAIMAMQRDETPLVHAETRLYLRDCYDHAVQVIDVVEIYREVVAGLVEMYLSNLSYRMNEVMKFLTIFATIFIPLGFIASLYGMNFDTRVSPWNMPELGWRWGYPFAIALMTGVAVSMLAYFRRKGWLGGGGSPARGPGGRSLEQTRSE
jgi:magnesium transporter